MQLRRHSRTRSITRALFAVLFVASNAAAQEAYRQPPAVIQRILDAPATPTTILTPDRTAILLLERPGLPPISEIAAPEYRVAGIRLDPRTSGPSRQNPARGISVMPISGGAATPIAMQLPARAGVGNPSWSPNGQRFAFVVSTDDALTLWGVRITEAPISPVRLLEFSGGRAESTLAGTPVVVGIKREHDAFKLFAK